MERSTFDQLFPLFLGSDPRHWVRFVPVPPLQAAYYHDVLSASGDVHRFLLHLSPSGTRDGFHRLVLEVGSHTTGLGGSLILDVTSTTREIGLDRSGLDFADAKWPSLDDALVRKAHEIVVRCRDAYGPTPSNEPLSCMN